jgi:hypothetical protein
VIDYEGPTTGPVPPCVAGTYGGSGPPGAACPDDYVTSAVVDLGDRDDLGEVDSGFTLLRIPVTVLGGAGRDILKMHSDGGNVLDGGDGNDLITSEKWDGYNTAWPGGADTVIGGGGDDDIRTRDERRDVVSCGDGIDLVRADGLDSVAGDCEWVERPEPPGPPVNVWQRPDGRAVGVTINGSAKYTNDRDVVLTVLAPPTASGLLISDDGAFSSPDWRYIGESVRHRYRLPSTGPERLPKTVYVRFDIDLSRTFTDEIVLDERRPRILRARLRGGRVVLAARDSTSGVKIAQFARVRKRPWSVIKFRKRFALRRTPEWVRVGDRAGNMSRWTRVRG